jgi:hypothetical protein
MVRGQTWLYIDTSAVDGTIDMMRDALSHEQFEALMYRTLKEVGNRAKVPVARAVQEEYAVKQAWVKGAMGNPRMSIGDGVQCVIPINGARGSIGTTDQVFKGSGGHRGAVGQKLKLRARILKGQSSTLPEKMSHQGGQPPFMNARYGVAMTRKTKARYPLAKVVGLGVPQMPLNQAKPQVQDEIIRLLESRAIHNFSHMFGGR